MEGNGIPTSKLMINITNRLIA